MIIASFDIGIKNLAVCILKLEEESQKIKIIQWNVFNLLEKEKVNQGVVSQCMFSSKKTKKGLYVNCKKDATYSKGELLYCKKHADIPKDITSKIINRAKLDVLYQLSEKYNISIDKTKNKKEIIAQLTHYINNEIFKEITPNDEETKEKIVGNSNHVNLIDIGISIKNVLDQHVNSDEIDIILIENQISPIANRMKSIQCMVSQYFIMKGKHTIYFVSSSNKLKLFTGSSSSSIEDSDKSVEKKESQVTSYSNRKKMGITITKTILSDGLSPYYNAENNHLLNWFASHKKKDDLADSYLQGLWYIKTKLKD
jgi:hypothetical protein